MPFLIRPFSLNLRNRHFSLHHVRTCYRDTIGTSSFWPSRITSVFRPFNSLKACNDSPYREASSDNVSPRLTSMVIRLPLFCLRQPTNVFAGGLFSKYRLIPSKIAPAIFSCSRELDNRLASDRLDRKPVSIRREGISGSLRRRSSQDQAVSCVPDPYQSNHLKQTFQPA